MQVPGTNGSRSIANQYSSQTRVEAVSANFSPPRSLFQPDQLGQLTGELTQEAWDWLNAPLPPLSVDIKSIRAVANRPDAEDRVAKLAMVQFDSDMHRSNKRIIAEGVRATIIRRADGLQVRRQEEVERFASRPRIVELLYFDRQKCISFEALPKLFGVIGWGLFFPIVILAELYSAAFQAQNAGIGLESNLLACFSFVLPTVAGCFVTLKFFYGSLSEKEQKTYVRILGLVGIPCCLVTLILFACLVGSHAEMDLFSEEPGAWTPPPQLFFFFSMTLLAMLSAMVSCMFMNAFRGLYVRGKDEDVLHADASDEIDRLDSRLDLGELVRSRMEALLEPLKAERATFIEVNLAELDRQRAAIQANLAQARSTLIS